MGLENPTRTQKLWAITRENGHKRENDEFLGVTLQHVSGLIGLACPLGTQKTVDNNS